MAFTTAATKKRAVGKARSSVKKAQTRVRKLTRTKVRRPKAQKRRR